MQYHSNAFERKGAAFPPRCKQTGFLRRYFMKAQNFAAVPYLQQLVNLPIIMMLNRIYLDVKMNGFYQRLDGKPQDVLLRVSGHVRSPF